MKKPKFISFLGFLIFVGISFFSLHKYVGHKEESSNLTIDSLKLTNWELSKLHKAYKNNSEQILLECQKKKLDPAYFLALSVLESSGKKKPKTRFEKKVYNHLRGVRDGRYRSFGSIKRKQLRGLSDGAIRNLATSWGPFQLMGYQAYELGVYVADIRGKGAIKHGIEWCDKRYGKYLKKNDFENAFHIHNTGKPIPKLGKSYTHDPNYIPNGMRYIIYFREKIKASANN